jgi:Uma2 family endonuclease
LDQAGTLECVDGGTKTSFAPICPDFVIELRSSSETLISLQDKIEERYMANGALLDMANGALLGWLVDRRSRTVYVYRPNQEPEVLDNPEMVSCDPELPGFVLRMAKIW